MSLKARMEAVIYAAEEPVTLAQLAAIFSAEVQPVEEHAPEAAPETVADTTAQAAADAAATAEPSTMDETPAPEAESEPAAKESAAAQAKAEQRRQREAVKAIVDELIADYDREGDQARGMEIREVAGGYRMVTRPEYHDSVRGFIKSLKPPLKLSLPALETLAVIAYKQPITAPEIGEIRGVDSSGVLGSLLTRKLITTAGRKQVIGRPILYKTTKDFLLRFGLKDVNELPSLEEFEKMAADVSDFDESPATEQDTLAFVAAETAEGETAAEASTAVESADEAAEPASEPETHAETAPAEEPHQP